MESSFFKQGVPFPGIGVIIIFAQSIKDTNAKIFITVSFIYEKMSLTIGENAIVN